MSHMVAVPAWLLWSFTVAGMVVLVACYAVSLYRLVREW